jgi:hypothetical protein
VVGWCGGCCTWLLRGIVLSPMKLYLGTKRAREGLRWCHSPSGFEICLKPICYWKLYNCTYGATQYFMREMSGLVSEPPGGAVRTCCQRLPPLQLKFTHIWHLLITELREIRTFLRFRQTFVQYRYLQLQYSTMYGPYHRPLSSFTENNTATALYFYLIFFCLSLFRYFFQQFYALTSLRLPPFCLSNGFSRSDLLIKALYFSYHSYAVGPHPYHFPWFGYTNNIQ